MLSLENCHGICLIKIPCAINISEMMFHGDKLNLSQLGGEWWRERRRMGGASCDSKVKGISSLFRVRYFCGDG